MYTQRENTLYVNGFFLVLIFSSVCSKRAHRHLSGQIADIWEARHRERQYTGMWSHTVFKATVRAITRSHVFPIRSRNRHDNSGTTSFMLQYWKFAGQEATIAIHSEGSALHLSTRTITPTLTPARSNTSNGLRCSGT